MEETASGVNPLRSTSMSTVIGPQPIVASRRRYSRFSDLLVGSPLLPPESNDGRFDAPTQFLDYVLRAFDQLHSLLNQLVLALKVAVASHNTVGKAMMRSDRVFRI